MTALDDVSLNVSAGSRLALVGENGAGKSTLMNVLYGLLKPTAGEIHLDGKPVFFRGPQDARKWGIGMVHQHFMLVPNLTVAENVMLGREPTRHGFIDFEKACALVEASCKEFGFQLNPRARIDELTVGSMQKVEIIKALHGGVQVLILDEPTSVLTLQEAEELFSMTRRLSEKGTAVVWITHKLADALRFSTHIAVMRKGRKVLEITPAETSVEALAEAMIGHPQKRATPPPRSPPGEAIVSLKNLYVKGAFGRAGLADISLQLRRGEIVGIAGVDGNGQRELAEVLTGLLPWQSGEVLIDGQPVSSLSPLKARSLGITHIPENRHRRGIVKDMTVEENLALGRHLEKPFADGFRIDFSGRSHFAEAKISAFDIRPAQPAAFIQELSGGNQQKVVLARETEKGLKVLVAVQPTRGLDFSAVERVHTRLFELAAEGAAVLLISMDLDEVLALSDRIYVLYEGQMRGEFSQKPFDAQHVGRRMLGAVA